MHRVLIDPGSYEADEKIRIEGDEAQHAVRVKRLGVGDAIECLDGQGVRISGEIAGIDRVAKGQWGLVIAPIEARVEPEPMPRLRVWSAVPKGPRAGELVEQLCQVGAAAWSPLHSKRSVVDPRAGKLARFDRIARESIKQSGRAHALRIESAAGVDRALQTPHVIVADASGDGYEPVGEAELTLLVGPEGGWSPDELRRLRDAGAAICRFGRHVMRIETAAVVAAGVILEREAAYRGSG